MLPRITLAICVFAVTAGVSSAWGQDDGDVPVYIKTGDPANPFTKDGQPLDAKRLHVFDVDRNTLQLTVADHVLNRGMGMGAMGMSMGSMGMEGGMEGGMMGGGPGGMAGGAEGGGGYGGASGGGMVPGMGMGGMGDMVAPATTVQRVYALVMNEEQANGRLKIEVLIAVRTNRGMGAGMGMGSMGGEGGGEMGSDGGMGMEGMGGGMSNLGQLIPLEGIVEFNAKRKQNSKAPSPWTKETATLAASFIRLHIWKQDAVHELKANDSSTEQKVASEKLLRELLSEDYDGQLARQQLEVTRLQQRLKNIESEIGRRRQAKERVVEVQLGKLVLESQGILGEGL